VQIGQAAIELENHVVPAPVVRDGVEALVEVRHEVHDPLEGLLADGSVPGRVSEQPQRLLNGRDHTAPAAIALGVVARCPSWNAHVVPGAGVGAAGADVVGPGGDFGEGGAGVEEYGQLGLGFGGEEGRGECGHNVVAGLAPRGCGECGEK